MSSSYDDVLIVWWQLRRKKRFIKRKYWIHPTLTNLICHSANICAIELQQHPLKFQNCYRMSPTNFRYLLNLIAPQVTKKDTNWREAIRPEEKLLITLRYLSTGSSFKELSRIFMRGATTIGLIIKDCTAAIWQVLQPLYMPTPTNLSWKLIAKRYYELWDLPNCIGSIDGKHIRIKKFYNTGSENINYKGYFSVVLLACADADSMFITIDVGEAGRNSDGAVFRTSTLGRLLEQNKLHIPDPICLPNEENEAFPYYFVADEAFPLKKDVMRPYPKRDLDNEKRIFNYRLSRGRKSVECAFGLLVSKFRLFEGYISCQRKATISIIKAACVLHNFIRKTEGKYSNPTVEKEELILNQQHRNPSRINKSANELRDHLKHYFIQPENSLPSQENYTV